MPLSFPQKDRLLGLGLGIISFFLIVIIAHLTNPTNAPDGGFIGFAIVFLCGLVLALIFGRTLSGTRLLNILGGFAGGFLLTFICLAPFFL